MCKLYFFYLLLLKINLEHLDIIHYSYIEYYMMVGEILQQIKACKLQIKLWL